MIRLPALIRFASVLLVSTVVGTTAWGQGAPALPALKPVFVHGGDAYLKVTFSGMGSATSVHAQDSGESLTESANLNWEVSGLLEVRTLSPAVGQRVFQVVGVAGELQGRLFETFNKTRSGIYGEGGLQDEKEVWVDAWVAPRVVFTKFPGVSSLNIDLDKRTWAAPELAEAFDRFVSGLQRAENYSGRWTPPRKSDEIYNSISSDKRQPPPGCIGDKPHRMAKVSAQEIGLTAKMDSPLPLAGGTQPKAKGAPDQLSGTAEATLKIGREGGRISGTISWEILRELPELELCVTAPKLKTWLPSVVREKGEGASSFSPGTPLEVTAEVIDPAGGSVSNLRIRRMRWWLEDTSRLPGAAMNWPYAVKDSSPDLVFDHVRATDEGQRLEFTGLTTLRKSIKVRPWDHGAWGTLRVEAELDDGRTLQGKIVGQEGGDPTAIRLPARKPDSKIASHWKDAWANGKADDADDDDIGAGKSKGDGLTVFEEYRGFYVNGKYERGIPLMKEVFVYDRIHDTDTNRAIEYFRTASETITYVIKPGMDELDDSRVVNRHCGNGPTRGDQHAIGLRRWGGAWVPSCKGERPGQAEVMIPSGDDYRRNAANLVTRSELYPRAIAQAMLRACGVPRPGFGDRRIYFTVTRGPDGAPEVNASGLGRVTVRDEVTRHDLGEDWLIEVDKEAVIVRARLGDRSSAVAESAATVAADAVAKRPPYHVAKRGGQHSGPVGNIMRDAFADAYLIEETKTVIMLSPSIPEKIGYKLSETSAGDDYNAAGDTPRMRYGDSKKPPSKPSFTPNDHAP